jgi:hypothetical protein
MQVQAATNNLVASAIDTITTDELFKHVEVLADDVYEGRSAGSRGGRAASQYIVQELRKYDLTPAGTRGDYVQVFDNDWRNILVLVPGNDPQLEREVVVVGGHYDHVGRGSSSTSYGPIGRIHNGADDNASGISIMLETIEAFATSGLRPRRSVLFAFWDGEERDLRGSRYWLRNPTVPVDRVKLAITLDMVGRLRGGQLYVLGSRSGYGLRRLMSGPVEDPLWLDFDWELSANSDHWSFVEKQIPVVLLHTGLHRDYHRPSDDAEKINRDGLREVSRYLLGMLMKAASADELPKFRDLVRRESDHTQRAIERPLPRASLRNWPTGSKRPQLGISWRADEAEPGAVFLTRVVEGTPAATAGLKVHDRIYEVDGLTFAGEKEFQATIIAMLESRKSAIEMLVEHRGKLRNVSIQMPAESSIEQ